MTPQPPDPFVQYLLAAVLVAGALVSLGWVFVMAPIGLAWCLGWI